MEVFVVSGHYARNYEFDTESIRVFAHKKDAVDDLNSRMFAAKINFQDIYDKDSWVMEKTEQSFEMHPKGYYQRDHASIKIDVVEVEGLEQRLVKELYL